MVFLFKKISIFVMQIKDKFFYNHRKIYRLYFFEIVSDIIILFHKNIKNYLGKLFRKII